MNTILRTLKPYLSAVTCKDRKLTAFLHWGNQTRTKKMRKKHTHTQCLKKQHAFELLSIFQNKSRVLFWILKEHRAISVSLLSSSGTPPSCCDGKLGHFSMTVQTTLGWVLGSDVLGMLMSVLVLLFSLQCCICVKVRAASSHYHSVNNSGP